MAENGSGASSAAAAAEHGVSAAAETAGMEERTPLTDTERAARKTSNVEQTLPAPAAERRHAPRAPSETSQPARETGDVEQAPASSAAEQRQAAGTPAEAPELAREQAPASLAAEQRQAAEAPAGTAELRTPGAEQQPLETQSRGFKHTHEKAPERASAEAHVNEKTEIEKMLREDALVAQALQDIEDAEYEERLAAVRAPRKPRRVRNKTRAAKST